MIVETLTIDRRFRGPAQSGNGGYVCGRIARHVPGTAQVRLAIPPPLDTPLEIDVTDGVARLMSGTTLVGEGRPAELDIEAPAPVSFEAATQRSKHYHGFDEHTFPECFVCGPHRKPGDGLRIFAGVGGGHRSRRRAVDRRRVSRRADSDGVPVGGSRLSERLRTVVAARRHYGRARSAHCVDSRSGDAGRQVRRDGLAAAGGRAQAICGVCGVFGEGEADRAGARDLDSKCRRAFKFATSQRALWRGREARLTYRHYTFCSFHLPRLKSTCAPQREHGTKQRIADAKARILC